MSVDDQGRKKLIAIKDGNRESTPSWREVLLGVKARRLWPAKLATGDGALGLWAALDGVIPSTTHQECWMHKTFNVFNYQPRTTRAKTKDDLHRTWMAESRDDAAKFMSLFAERYLAKYSRAVTYPHKDLEQLLAFHDSPAERWLHIRITDDIESTSATLRHRTKHVKGTFSKVTALVMMLQLGLEAQERWHRITAVERLGELIQGVRFVDGGHNSLPLIIPERYRHFRQS